MQWPNESDLFFKAVMDVKQRLAISAVGLGYLMLRNMNPSTSQLHEQVASDKELVKWNRALSVSLSELLRVASCDSRLMGYIHEFREQDQRSTRSSSFHMNRLIGIISAELHHIVRHGSRSLNASDLRENVYVEQDVVPTIRSHLESILHNHMLRNLV